MQLMILEFRQQEDRNAHIFCFSTEKSLHDSDHDSDHDSVVRICVSILSVTRSN